MTKRPISLEQKLEELEHIVVGLEKNGLNLDDNIKSFEQGAKLYKECKTILNHAEKRVKKLTDSLREEDLP